MGHVEAAVASRPGSAPRATAWVADAFAPCFLLFSDLIILLNMFTYVCVLCVKNITTDIYF